MSVPPRASEQPRCDEQKNHYRKDARSSEPHHRNAEVRATKACLGHGRVRAIVTRSSPSPRSPPTRPLAWPPVTEVARRDLVTEQSAQVLRGGWIEVREQDDHQSKFRIDIERVVDARARATVVHNSVVAQTTDEEA